MKVIIAGEIPFVHKIGELCGQAGHLTHVFLVEDFWGAIEKGYLIEEINDAEIVIEIHNETPATKHELLLALDKASPPETLFMSSALAVSATQAAAWIMNPDRSIGFGLMPPIGNAGIVELAPALQTSEESLSQATLFWQGIGFRPMVVADGPGLVRGRLVCSIINEAITALMEGVATAADIDEAMKLGTNYPYGPLEWGDLIGLDTVLGVMNGLFAEWGDDRYRPAPLLRRMVAAGRLGKKTRQGFYTYD